MKKLIRISFSVIFMMFILSFSIFSRPALADHTDITGWKIINNGNGVYFFEKMWVKGSPSFGGVLSRFSEEHDFEVVSIAEYSRYNSYYVITKKKLKCTNPSR